jgi:histone H3/H4
MPSFPKAEVERLLRLAEEELTREPEGRVADSARAEAYAHIADVWATLWVAQQ